MLLLNLILLIDVTFSTPTPVYNSYVEKRWSIMRLNREMKPTTKSQCGGSSLGRKIDG
jgi:hypothetical protein